MYKKLFSKGRVKYLKAGARLIFVVDSQLKLYLSMQPWSLMSGSGWIPVLRNPSTNPRYSKTKKKENVRSSREKKYNFAEIFEYFRNALVEGVNMGFSFAKIAKI
jgi:hypothetical protein